jgi:hypothetical protein
LAAVPKIECGTITPTVSSFLSYGLENSGKHLFTNTVLPQQGAVADPPSLLIVVDDDGASYIRGTSLPEFESALIAAGYSYSVWTESIMGNPSLEYLLGFDLVIWTCGDYWDWAVDPTDATTLESYLAYGGKILLEGEDIGYNHGSDNFMVNVAHAIMDIDGTGAPGLTVSLSHPVTQGLPTTMPWETPPPYDDCVLPINGGLEVIRYTGTSWTAVTIFDGTGTGYGLVVYYSFPVYSLAQPERSKMIINSVQWLSGVGGVLGRVALFQNVIPWEYPSNEEALSKYGVSYDIFTSNDFGYVNLGAYSKVVIASDQDQAFYDAMEAYRWWFEDYVSNGGILEIHAADLGWHGGGWIGLLPGGCNGQVTLGNMLPSSIQCTPC